MRASIRAKIPFFYYNPKYLPILFIKILILKKGFEFVYKAIRALGANSISSRYSDNYVFFRFHFKKGNPAFLDLRPPVQVCLIEKRALSLQNYKIVYPYDYIENYA